MICASCHKPIRVAHYVVLRDDGDAGVAVCTTCRDRHFTLGLLVPCEPPRETTDTREPADIAAVIARLQRTLGL